MTKIWPITIETKEGDIISPNFPAVLRRFLAQLKTKDGKWELVARRPKRSNPQNRYYWGIVVEMVKMGLIESGNYIHLESDLVHEFLKQKFGVKINIQTEQVLNVDPTPYTLGGTIITFPTLYVPKSTSKYTTGEFTAYLEAIRQWASEFLGVEIPGPEEAKKNLLI